MWLGRENASKIPDGTNFMVNLIKRHQNSNTPKVIEHINKEESKLGILKIIDTN